MNFRAFFLLVTMSWSAVAGATGGILYTCSMKSEAVMTRCCCPSKKTKAAGESETLSRNCCEASSIAANDAPVRFDEPQRSPVLTLAALPVSSFVAASVFEGRVEEIIARATAPPPREDLYLEVRTLLL